MGKQLSRRISVEPGDEREMDGGIFRTVVHEMTGYVFVCATDCRIIYMNPSLMKKLGRDATGEECHKALDGLGEVCPSCIFDLPVDCEPVNRQLTSPMDGHVYDVSVMMVNGLDGRRYGITIMCDITEQKRSRERLLEDKRIFDGVVNSLPGIFILFGEDMRPIFWNRNLESVSGFSAGEIEGIKVADISPELEKELSNNRVNSPFEQVSISLDIHMKRKDGGKDPYSVSVCTFTINGKTYFVVSGENPTEKCHMESMLEHDELMKSQQQDKMASIGRLAAGVAHEINNPLGFISSNLNTLGKYMDRLVDFIQAQWDLIEMITDDGSSFGLKEKHKALKIDHIQEDGKELIRESLEGAERVRTIVRNLQGFSAMEESECRPVDINGCIDNAIESVFNEGESRFILEKELVEIPPVRCHPQQIEKVFRNLLSNAAHAAGKQGTITVRTWHENGSLYASIGDNGCGIPPDKMTRIFEPFYTTREVGEGIGLGLSSAYDIMKCHNGEISVESVLGKGTTFTVRLPMVEG